MLSIHEVVSESYFRYLPMNARPLRWQFTPSEQEVRRVLGCVRDDICAAGIDEGAIITLEIVLAEVLNNIVEHACAAHAAPSCMISYAPIGSALRITVRDNGTPMPNLELPAGKEQAIDVPRDDLPEGGFGWNIIRTLTQNLRYQRTSDENILCFDIAFANEG